MTETRKEKMFFRLRDIYKYNGKIIAGFNFTIDNHLDKYGGYPTEKQTITLTLYYEGGGIEIIDLSDEKDVIIE